MWQPQNFCGRLLGLCQVCARFVVDGKIIGGRQGIAGEWGHIFLDKSGGECYCGKTGCVETVLSGPALEKYYESIAGKYLTLKEITDLARAIYFNTGKYTFTDETSIRLEKIYSILANYTTLNFRVEGHTDNTGSDKINDKLSQERANAVMDYLVKAGFPADKIKAVGFGSANPIGDNKTKKGRLENRRVEIYQDRD